MAAMSSSAKNSDEAHSFTLSYRVDSCGLSPESAMAADSCGLSPESAMATSKKVQFQSPTNLDSVLAFLRIRHFSETQIATFVSKGPNFLLSNPEKPFLPKVELFYSKRNSKPNLANMLCSRRFVLKRSLSGYIEPTYDLLKTVIRSEDELVSALARHQVEVTKHWGNVVANLGLLREPGFSDAVVESVLRNLPVVITADPSRFRALVRKLKGMGFDPESHTFMLAMHTFSSLGMENR